MLRTQCLELLAPLLLVGKCFAQDGGFPEAETRTQLLTLSTNIPFFAEGQCNTIVSCENLGTATVKTVTTTLPGILPSGTAVTITPTVVKPTGTNTVFVCPPAQEIGLETIYKTVTPGETLTESIPSSPETGAPVTIWVFPGGPQPETVVTVTSTLSWGHAGSKTLTLGPSKYLVGITPTVTVIPPVTSNIEVSVCPPQATVTVTREPQVQPLINVTESDGNVRSKPASKFPCSDSDLNPCRGTQVQGWTVFKTLFDAAHPWNGKSYPGPWKKAVEYDYDTILTVSDSWYQAEHWTITLDGEKLGETYEDGFKNEKISCSWNGDECIQKGFSHGSFWIPKGKHDLQIEWTDGPLTYGSGSWWTHGYGVYRFDRPCKCSASAHDEL